MHTNDEKDSPIQKYCEDENEVLKVAEERLMNCRNELQKLRIRKARYRKACICLMTVIVLATAYWLLAQKMFMSY